MGAAEQSIVGRVRRKIFARHANPWSAWTRWASTPLVLVPFWTRRWEHGGGVAAWMLANPVVFPEPADDENWATRAILGEELWVQHRPRDQAMVINGAGSACLLGAIVAAWRHRPLPMSVFTGATMALTMWYWRMMSEYYEEHRPRERGGQR